MHEAYVTGRADRVSARASLRQTMALANFGMMLFDGLDSGGGGQGIGNSVGGGGMLDAAPQEQQSQGAAAEDKTEACCDEGLDYGGGGEESVSEPHHNPAATFHEDVNLWLVKDNKYEPDAQQSVGMTR